MTQSIGRFIDDEDSSALQSFIDLFGDPGYRDAWRGLRELDREDRIVETYCDRVRQAGAFAHCVATIILNPRHDRTHYHLVHATRSLHGLVAFRETERRAMSAQREARAEVKQRERVTTNRQGELYDAAVMETAYMSELEDRYRGRAHDAARGMLCAAGDVDFDVLVAAALQHPMTCLTDLKAWIEGWRAGGVVELLGLAPGERALAIQRGHRLRWRGGLLFDP